MLNQAGVSTPKEKTNPKGGRPSQRPPYEVLLYLSEDKGMQTKEIAEFVGVQPSTIRAWRCLARQGKY